eukprot:3286882-Pyramimonas_sp.AAC.1
MERQHPKYRWWTAHLWVLCLAHFSTCVDTQVGAEPNRPSTTTSCQYVFDDDGLEWKYQCSPRIGSDTSWHHSAELSVAGNTIPYGATLCLTPSDASSVEVYCRNFTSNVTVEAQSSCSTQSGANDPSC